MARTKNQIPRPPGPRGLIECESSTYPPLSTSVRAEYTRNGCTVYGWPSTGGVIARSNCDAVELKYLGWDPLEAPESREEDQAAEDEFCNELKKIGGRWWGSRRRFLDITNEEYLSSNDEATEDELREVWIGWPEGGGILVLDDVRDESPLEVGVLRLATTMEERCSLMREKFNAVYYEDPKIYAGFATPPDKSYSRLHQDIDSFSINTGRTPSETEYPDSTIGDDGQRSIASHPTYKIPKPGSTYIIRSISSSKIITLLRDQVVLALPDKLASCRWECVENNGWLGFRNTVNDRFLGRGDNWLFCCTVKWHRAHEYFHLKVQQEGGFVLVMTHYERLRPVGTKKDNDMVLAMVENGDASQIVWEFVEV